MPFQIVRNDITKIKADAVVNTANPDPVYGEGSDSAVYRAAGAEKLLKARKEIGRLAVGEAAATPAFDLDAKYIIHTTGPLWQGGWHGEVRKLKRCYKNSLDLALEKGCESVAFPLISTGVYGFPKDKALRAAVSAISEFLSKEDMTVYLVVFDRESFEVSGKIFSGIDSYIDENYVEDKTAEEYGSPVPGFSAAPASAFLNFPGEERKPAEVFSEEPAAAYHEDMPKAGFRFLSPERCPAPMQSAPAAEYNGSVLKSPKKAKRTVSQNRSLEDVVSQLGETFQERLFRLIDERHLTDVEVYKRANLDRKLFSKIRCNADYRPKKITALALAVALELNLDETKDLLSRAELALSPSSKFDLIISYFIEREVYDIYTINLALFQHEQPVLGA